MVSASAINYVVGTIGLISFMFNIGEISDDLYIYGGQPWVAVIYRITNSKAATIVMILVVAVNVGLHPPDDRSRAELTDTRVRVLLLADQHGHDLVQTDLGFCARQRYVCGSNENNPLAPPADIAPGLPFHRFLAKVESDGLPRNSVWVTLGFTALLSLVSPAL